MKINYNKLFVAILTLGITFNFFCSPKELNTWEFEDSLVYVEGKELFAGRFGDVVLLDKDSESIIKITNDSYFDSNPFFFKDSTIAFISKRRKKDLGSGLAKSDDLYLFSLEDKSLSMEISDAINPIFIKNDDSYIYYMVYGDGGYELRNIENLENDSVYMVTKYIPDLLTRFTVATNSEKILYEYIAQLDGIFVSTLMLYDIQKNEKIDFLQKLNKEKKEKLFRNSCFSGTFHPKENKFLFSCQNYSNNATKLFEYNYEEESLNELFSSTTLIMKNINYGKSGSIYFIGYSSDEERDDIWMINDNGELIQITDSNTEKDNLDVR
ncbi:MAG: hypothetical protein JJ892_01690 [Balneola sp.]|nr:hypothetical protein [Balneola sp.]MBO6651513.1 hypothetical protein [Balneola sp.]MBO6710276.1 hypothetical protein [Balneola sp.]MBO6798961.1 hypothetical protein [Balneola sp.]MBO6870075.1 hypothetical protein [Balneola sp.]